MYHLEPTEHEAWGRAVKLNGCTYRRNKHTGRVCNSRPHTSMFDRLFTGLKAGDMYLHLCDNPPCIDPEHVRGGTHAENMEDAKAKGRNRATLTRKQREAAKLAIADGFPVRAVALYFRVSEQAIVNVTSL